MVTILAVTINHDVWIKIHHITLSRDFNYPYKSPKSEPALELISRAVPSVEAHHCSVGSDAGRNSGGRQIMKKCVSAW